MPYAALSDLPLSIRKLPVHAQEIFFAAFNHAWKEYASAAKRRDSSSREVTARRVAWSAVKRVYEKTQFGWIRRGEVSNVSRHHF